MVLAEVAFNAYAPVFLQEGIDIPLPHLFRCPVSPWNLYREAIPLYGGKPARGRLYGALHQLSVQYVQGLRLFGSERREI